MSVGVSEAGSRGVPVVGVPGAPGVPGVHIGMVPPARDGTGGLISNSPHDS